MLEFSVNEQEYRAGKLNAFQQLHVSRKIAGVLPKMLPAMILAAGAEDGDLSNILVAFEPAAEALAAMPEADVDFLFHTCLAVVSRRQGNGFAAIWNPAARALMFDDIGLQEMSQIVFAVLQDSLGPFIRGLVAKVPAASPKPPAA